MKKIIFCFLTCSMLVIFGCEKQQINSPLNKRIIGEWKFLKAIGGLTGKQVILPPADTISTLILNANYQFKRTINGKTVEQGNYDLTRVKSIFTGELDDAIRFNDFSTQAGLLISVKNDSLWITDNHVEPFGSLFIRVN